MKYLLDTHYVLWTLFEPTRIAGEIKKIFEDNTITKYVSGITLWEISLKYSIGKLKLVGTNPYEIYKKIEESGFKLLQLENRLISSYYKLSKKENHKNPFDRMLIWQAITNDFILITNDKQIKQYIENGLKIKLGI
ncbi:MAG TPA: type II toxin-antitoxin system VapC family toxin [Spirochaetes bacterium]|nr:type II toxin-antitoxin system VapC family toxin [Spirochaetota bacterium]